ncbi:MAG TPA: ABC transporter permease, partial [Chitinophagaceae bacterium]
MLVYIIKRLAYGLLVLLGVIILVFFLFQGFGDPSRLVMGQTGDAATQEAIRKELYLDQPKWKQFLFYLNDVSPVGIHTEEEIKSKDLSGFFIGGETKLALKLPYLRKSYQTKKAVGAVLMEALPGTIILAFAAMFIAVLIGIPLGVLAAVRQNTWMDTS